MERERSTEDLVQATGPYEPIRVGDLITTPDGSGAPHVMRVVDLTPKPDQPGEPDGWRTGEFVMTLEPAD